MLKLTARRIATSVPIMAIVATFTFILVQLVPRRPGRLLPGTGAAILHRFDPRHAKNTNTPGVPTCTA